MNVEEVADLAADLAAITALLEITEGLGLSAMLDRGAQFSITDLAVQAHIPHDRAGDLLEALLAAGLVDRIEVPETFRPVPHLADLRHQAGYLSWSLNANRPYIENAKEFLQHPDQASGKYHRDGRQVAVSSKWVGSYGFYPLAVAAILERRPRRILDLGAGTGGLLVRLLGELPEARGTALDMSPAACAEARRSAAQAGLTDRMDVLTKTIESLAEDPSPLHDADVVHAGFVLHDVVAVPAALSAVLRACHEHMAPEGRLIVTDAVPFAAHARERAFSALFTYLHASFMNIHLPTEEQWIESFQEAGFVDVTAVSHRMPGSRLFIASR